MTIFGLNSPEIFILLLIFLFILGPKRIEKIINTFPRFIKFLLNDEKNYKVILEEKESESPVIEEKELESPVIEEKELASSNSGSTGKKEIKVVPVNPEEEKKVKRKKPVRSIKNSVKTKGKTLKPNKEKQTSKEKSSDNTK